jgi:putative salt-induced outer membrane protein YdiY
VRVQLVIAILMLAVPAPADQLTLKNGDRLIKTDYAGEVTVKYDSIQAIESPNDLHVGLSDGKTVVGPVSTSGDNLVVATKTAGPVEAPKSSVATLRGPAEEAAYQKKLHPGWAEGWEGGIDLGFALTRGNSQTKNLNIALNADRTGSRDKLHLYMNSIYATNDLPTAIPHTTANAIGGGARYDHNLTSLLFAFVNADFFHDELQTLDLRSIVGGGLGFHAIKGESTTLDLLAGVNYTHESYSAPFDPASPNKTSRNLAALTLGDEFSHKLRNTVITQNLYFYPDLTNTGEYRWKFTFGTVTKISKWLGWQNSFGDIYLSDPPFGKKKNDLLLSTGLNFSFVH